MQIDRQQLASLLIENVIFEAVYSNDIGRLKEIL